MSHTFSEERFREAAEAEGGMSISAGARSSHVRAAVEAGRVFYVDLSGVPEDERPAVAAQIKGLVDEAVGRVAAKEPNLARRPSDPSRGKTPSGSN